MAIAYIGLGSNQEHPKAQLQQAFAQLAALPHTWLLAHSSLYASAPVGYLDQPDFVNAVAQLDTALSPTDLLQALLDVEQQHGRVRTFRNAPRTLDLDLLLYDQQTLALPHLHVPHPQMHLRAFVLHPLLEIAPDCHIPGFGPAAEALVNCQDQTLTRLA